MKRASGLCGGEHTNLLVLHSTSKRSNLAGYRAGFIAGDVALIAELLGVRKHSGMMLPTPVQAAMAAVLADQRHVLEQRERYRRRRAQLAAALLAAGFRIDDSQGSLRMLRSQSIDHSCWHTSKIGRASCRERV